MFRFKRVLFFCHDLEAPSGGRKMIYWMSDTLNSMNIEACVVHKNPRFKLSWFSNQTTVKYFPNKLDYLYQKSIKSRLKQFVYSIIYSDVIEINKNEDLLIFPETWLSNQTLKIIEEEFNVWFAIQNSYFLLNKENQLIDGLLSLFKNEKVHLICFSQLNFQIMYNLISSNNPLLQTENKNLHRFTVILNPKLYLQVADEELLEKKSHSSKLKIAYMPRRGNNFFGALLNYLNHKNVKTDDFEFIKIDGLPQEDVFSILLSSHVFLSFSEFEGFGLPLAEAIACGNIIVGSSAGGGREFLDKQSFFEVNNFDYSRIYKTLRFISNYKALREKDYFFKISDSRSKILNSYSEENARTMLNEILLNFQ
jgi:glycosyltransferase involved in cell wall biosynthesis